MPGPKPESIHLTQTQPTVLESIVNRQKSPQHLVRRAQIILAADSQQTNEQIAKNLAINRNTVRVWRCRFSNAAESLYSYPHFQDKNEMILRWKSLCS